MWFYPWLTYISILGILAVLVSMAFTEDGRPQLLATIVSVILFLGAYFLRSRYGGHVESRSARPVGE